LEDRRNVGESSCNFGDGTDQRVQSLTFIIIIIIIIIIAIAIYVHKQAASNYRCLELAKSKIFMDIHFSHVFFKESLGQKSFIWVAAKNILFWS